MSEHLGDVSGDLESESDGDCELSMCPSDLECVALPLGELGESEDEPVNILLDDLNCSLYLECGGGVDDIVGGGTVVNELAGITLALLGHGLDHGHEVVPGILLDLLDPIDIHDIKAGDACDLLCLLLGDRAERGMCPCQSCLYIHLVLEAALFVEYGFHVFAAVSVIEGTQVAHLNQACDSRLIIKLLPMPL